MVCRIILDLFKDQYLCVFCILFKTMNTTAHIIAQTKKWITDVVVGCNFCPFAAREVKKNSIYYRVETGTSQELCLKTFLEECTRLDKDPAIETSFIIFPNAFQVFNNYLQLVSGAEKMIKERGYEGIYQVASFHPAYRFADAQDDDAANYTNRSVYPMLHLLREERIEQALERYANPELIPGRNIDFARKKGLTYMKMLRDACL